MVSDRTDRRLADTTVWNLNYLCGDSGHNDTRCWCLILRQPQLARHEKKSNETSQSLFSVINLLLHNRAAIGYGLLLIAIGIGNCGVQQFEILYMDQLGSSDFPAGSCIDDRRDC